MKGDPDIDPKGLIHEAFRIDGITAQECRSIFLDWALSLPAHTEPGAAIRQLLGRYAPEAPDHPMTGVLKQGRGAAGTPRRRGGWRGRPRD